MGTKYTVLAILVSAATGKYEMQRLRGQRIFTQEKVKTGENYGLKISMKRAILKQAA